MPPGGNSVKVYTEELAKYLEENFKNVKWVADKTCGFIVSAVGGASIDRVIDWLSQNKHRHQKQD